MLHKLPPKPAKPQALNKVSTPELNSPRLPQTTPQSDFGTFQLMSPFQFTSSAPYQSPHIPNCTRQLEGHLIGCLMNSPSANKDGAGFPSNFDPRMEPNMPATKKVIGWLNELPVDITAPRSFKNGCFELEHYNGLEVEDLIELLWPDEDAAIECSTDELIASQAKQIEFLTSKLYSMEYTRTPEEVTKTALRSSPPSYNVRLINR